MNAEDAFSPTHDRAHFFASSVAEDVLAQLQHGLDHELPVIVVTGEPDVGKSAVVREACARWGVRVRAEWLVMPGAKPDALLPQVVRLFGGKARGDDSRAGCVVALSRTLGIVGERDKLPLLIVENAHTLSPEALVELAAIHATATAAKRSLRMILIGTPELLALLDDLYVDPLTRLVGVRSRVAPLPAPDVRHYLQHRVAAAGGDGERVFSRKAARELHTASHGLPGVLDELAAEAILVARKAGMSTVGQEHVRAAVTAARRTAAVEAAPPVAQPQAATVPPPPAPEPRLAPPTISEAPAVAPAPIAPPAPPVAEGVPDAPPMLIVKPAKSASTRLSAKTRQALAAAANPESAPAVTTPPAAKQPAPRSSAPKPATAPAHAGGDRRAKPVPPPPAAPVSDAELPQLDSRHPRVKEWVSRFTEGDGQTRFGARLNLPPLTDPDSLPTYAAPEPEVPPALKRTRKAARAAEPIVPAPAQRAPEPEPAPVAYTPPPSAPEPIVIVPEPIVLAPEPIVLGPDAVSPVHEPASRDPNAQQSHGGSRDPRRKRRKREREQAAAAKRAPGAASEVVPPTAAVRSPVLAASAGPPPPRRVIIDDSVTQEPFAPEGTESPEPVRMLTGPRSPAHGRFLHVVVPGLLMLGVAAAAIIAGTRSGFDHDPPEHVPAQVTSSAQQVEPALPPLTIDTDQSLPSALGPAPSADTAAPTITPTITPIITPTPADSAPARYCLAVGTYLFSDRARIMSRHLSQRTGLDAWVETVESGGSRNYRILLGGFASQGAAEKAADRLLGRGIVSEAMVEPLPSGHANQ